MKPRTLGELANVLGAELVGDGAFVVHGVADLAGAGPQQLSFVRSGAYREQALASRAGALLVAERLAVAKPQLVSHNVGVDFARIAAMFHPQPTARAHRVDPLAQIDPTAILEAPVEVGPFAVVGPRTRIGRGSILSARVTIGPDCVLGNDCYLHPGVVLYDRVQLGHRVQVHANSVLGADGFGYARDGATYVKIPQVGRLLLGDDVEVGANCTLDRGAIGDTRIGRGTKIDNLVHIAHNCVIGEDVAIAAMTALAGSTTIGDRVQLAGHVVSAGHLSVATDARIGGNSVLINDVRQAGDYMGYPLMPKRRWLRTLGWLARQNKPQPQQAERDESE